MESKIKTASGNIYEKWTNYEKQIGIQFFDTVNPATGKMDRKWRFRFRFRGKLYSEVIGWESRKLSEKKIMEIWDQYAANRTLGQEPFSPGGAVEIQEAAREEVARKEAEARSHTITSLFYEAMKLREVTTKPEHVEGYTRLFRNWIEPLIGELPIHGLKAVHVADMLKAMQAGKVLLRPLSDEEKKYYREKPRSAQTQGHAWNTLRVVWTYARDNKLVADAFPGAKLKPKINNERMRYLTEHEANAVLADLRGEGRITAGGHGTGGRKGSMDAWGKALLSIHCGLRAGEIFDLTWRNLDMQARIGIVYDTKNQGTSRKFYMTPAVVQMFQERFSFSKYTKSGDLVFPNRQGERVAETGDVFTRCFKRLGLNKGDETAQDKVVFHTLRHTFATWLAQRGTPMSVIAELMGHNITKTTERYIQYAPKTIIKDAISFFTGMHEDFRKTALEEEERDVIDITQALPE